MSVAWANMMTRLTGGVIVKEKQVDAMVTWINPFESQITRIKTKIPLAKAKDPDLKVFGAEKHRYMINPCLAPAEVAHYEQKSGIRLPEEYKTFIVKIGNGGAGPYYGIRKLDTGKQDEFLKKPCKLRPDLTDEAWNALISFSHDDNLDDETYDLFHHELFHQGILTIGSMGCTYEMKLIISGDDAGRVVYIDENLAKPFFTYEDHFLDWYERWLDEIIQGYEIHWFGMNMAGDEAELIQKFMVSESEITKVAAISSMNKLPNLLPNTVNFLHEQCLNHVSAIKTAALKILTKNCYAKAKPYLQQLLAGDNEDEQLSALRFIFWYLKEPDDDVLVQIKTLLSKTKKADNFRIITYILEKAGLDISLMIPFFYHEDPDIRKQAVYQAGKSKNQDKEKYQDEFIHCLKDKEVSVILTTVQALSGVTHPKLLPYYEELLKKYPEKINSIQRNIKHNLEAFGKH